MPVSSATLRDPFRGGVVRVKLRIPQARILQALMPECVQDPVSEWPLLSRPVMAARAGYTGTSGSVTRVLNGIRPGSSSGEAHTGALGLGFVEVVEVDVEGVRELNYRITKKGVSALQEFLANGGKLPPVRDKISCTNDRYLYAWEINSTL